MTHYHGAVESKGGTVTFIVSEDALNGHLRRLHDGPSWVGWRSDVWVVLEEDGPAPAGVNQVYSPWTWPRWFQVDEWNLRHITLECLRPAGQPYQEGDWAELEATP